MQTIFDEVGKKKQSNFDLGHQGTEAHEEDDGLALRPFYGPEPYGGLTKSLVSEAINKWAKIQMKSYGEKIPA